MELYREGLQSYLKNYISENEYFCKVEYQVIHCNHLESLLPIQLREEDQKHIVFYEITGKQSLESLKSKDMLSEKECQNLMKDIISVLRDMEEYMLILDHIHFSAASIFQDISGKNYFVYNPEVTYSSREDMVSLFSWMVEHINYEDRKAVEFIYHVYYEVKKQDVTKNLLEECLNYQTKKKTSYESYFKNREDNESNLGGDLENRSSMYKNDNGMKNYGIYNTQSNEATEEKKGDQIFFILRIVFVFLTIAAMCGVVYLLFLGYQQNLIRVYGRYAAGAAIFVVLFVYGAYQMNLLYNNPVEETGIGKNPATSSMPQVPAFKTEEKTSLLSGGGSDSGGETVLLFDDRVKRQPALKDLDTGEVYMIRSYPAFIGTDINQCQIIVKDNTVSRRHAMIDYDSARMKYIIEDLNSSNGSMLDQSALPPGNPMVIEPGQVLTLARKNFEFFSL